MIKRIVYDKSVYGATRAGVYVFAEGVLHALKSERTLDVVEFDNPFSTVGKSGIARKIISIFRMFYSEFIGFFYKKETLFFFPAPEMSIFVALLRLDFAITIHDLFTWKNTNKTTVFARIRQLLLPFYAKRANFIITVSEYSKSEIVECFGVDPKKIVICQNGLPVSRCRKESSTPSKYKANYYPYVLFVGSSEPRKNLQFLIEVFDATNRIRTILGLKLVTLVMTCGEAWASADLAKRVALSPYSHMIITTGHVNETEKEELYKNASVTVLPSLAEGFGIPVIESLSHGTPIIVQNNTALSMFSEYGASVIDNFDAHVWASHVNEIIDNCVRVPQIMIDKVVLTFNWSHSVRSILERIK